MKAQWSSIDEIATDLGLEHLRGDRAGLRVELRRRLVAAHPDAFGGAFPDEQHATVFRGLEAALRFVESRSEVALIPAERMDLLAAKLVEALEKAQSTNDQALGNTVKSSVAAFSRRQVFWPRITSATLFALCSVLLAFPKRVVEHPLAQPLLSALRPDYLDSRAVIADAEQEVLGEMAATARRLSEGASPEGSESPSGESASSEASQIGKALDSPSTSASTDFDKRVLSWIAHELRLTTPPKDLKEAESVIDERATRFIQDRLAFMCLPLLVGSAVGLLWTWLREGRIRNAVEHIASEEALHDVFDDLLEAHRARGGFGFRDLISRVRIGVVGAPPLSGNLAEQTAVGIVDRLLQRGVITKGSPRGVDLWYRFSVVDKDRDPSATAEPTETSQANPTKSA